VEVRFHDVPGRMGIITELDATRQGTEELEPGKICHESILILDPDTTSEIITAKEHRKEV